MQRPEKRIGVAQGGRVEEGNPLEQVASLLRSAPELYHRLILVVAPAGQGKTQTLRSLQQKLSAPLVNLNLELSRCLLELTERQRKLQASRDVAELIAQAVSPATGDHVVLVDNIEILFDASLSIDPLRLLEDVSRNWTLVVGWRGNVEGDYLIYAKPGHPEYRRYPARDLTVVRPSSAMSAH